jgi:serine/threonine-protein kinase
MADPFSVQVAALSAALAGDYVIEREIGRGGMGIVYRARDVKLDRPVAVKVLPPHLADVADVRERFLREARTAARLTHPNIVPIHRADELGGFVFFVMSLVEGESLAERLRARGRLSPDQAVPLLADVARALGYAHAHGVVHRDIKPENVLIDAGSGRPMVTDFGIARLAEASPLTATGQVLGTVHFMSPEQVSGDTLDGRSDLYSLGVVGYLALSAHYPFDGATASAVLVAHVTKIALPLRELAPNVGPTLAAIIDRCLKRNPDDRFATGSDLAHALDAAAGRGGAPPAREQPPENALAAPGLPPVLSEREAMAVWQRAAELQALTSAASAVPAKLAPEQAEAARSLTRGYRLEHVREAAIEAGISEPYVRRAVEEVLRAQPAAAVSANAGASAGEVASVESSTGSRWAKIAFGAPLHIHLEAREDGEVPEADFDVLLDAIRRSTQDPGHVGVFGRTLSWSNAGGQRQLSITISSRGGQTTIRVDERVGPLAGALFGGLGGGLGGGGAGGVAALSQYLLGPGSIGLSVVAYMGGVLLLARTLFTRAVRRRQRRHRALLDELRGLVRGMVENPAPAIGSGTVASADRRLLG